MNAPPIVAAQSFGAAVGGHWRGRAKD